MGCCIAKHEDEAIDYTNQDKTKSNNLELTKEPLRANPQDKLHSQQANQQQDTQLSQAENDNQTKVII